MYLCKECWNTERFTERYSLEEYLIIRDWEKVNTYDCNKDLMEVVCENCNWNTEDWKVTLNNWDKIQLNQL